MMATVLTSEKPSGYPGTICELDVAPNIMHNCSFQVNNMRMYNIYVWDIITVEEGFTWIPPTHCAWDFWHPTAAEVLRKVYILTQSGHRAELIMSWGMWLLLHAAKLHRTVKIKSESMPLKACTKKRRKKCCHYHISVFFWTSTQVK